MLDFNKLFDKQRDILSRTPAEFKRSLFYEINWEYQLIEIYGARGVGKTTLILQRIRQLKNNRQILPLYVSADDPVFFEATLYDLAEQFYKLGGTHLFIDEIHRYPAKNEKYDWSAEIKYIYDSYPGLQVVYSGSSAIELYKGHGDLSRRKISYKLNGLSFREYLEFNNLLKFDALKLENILAENMKISEEISGKLKILPAFHEYLETGYYPFFKKTRSKKKFYEQIRNIINVVLENDLPSVVNIQYKTVNKLKKLFSAIATSPPYTSQLGKLAQLLDIKNYNFIFSLLQQLEHADLLLQLKQQAKGNKIMQKPDKIYLNNTNLMYALDLGNISIGTVRETFFLNQLNYKHSVYYPKNADFLVDGKWLFEIGGKNKTQKQIAGYTDAYIAADEIEIGFGNKVPVWLFGFLY